MKMRGFTLTEIAVVAAIVSTLSVGGYQIVKKGKDSVCINNLKQIGQAIAMFEADHDGFPSAVFYPSDANDPRGIHNLLKRYGATSQLFFCPAISAEFNRYGTNYLWNESAAKEKQSTGASGMWLMTEITSLYPELPTPHTGGYGVLYADGHAAIGRNLSFPSFERKPLASNITAEKQKDQVPDEKKEEIKEEKPISQLDSYMFLNIPSIIQAGKPVSISIKAVDREGNTYESNEKLKIIDFSQTVEPSEITLHKGIANVMVVFKKAYQNNVLTAIDSKGVWNSSKEFTVEPAQVASMEIIPPSLVYAGIAVNFRLTLKDMFGNIISKEGIKISVVAGGDAEYLSEVLSDVDGQIVIPFVFRKAGEIRISFSVSGTTIKESCSVKVRPGPVEKFEISEIKSPVEAGNAISVTIKAIDKYGNRAKGFMFSDGGNTPLYLQEDMSSGIWMETIKFEKAVTETFIEVNDGMGHTGRSRTFSVIPSSPSVMRLLNDSLVFIENQECGIEFSVSDRYGNSISGLETRFTVDGISEFKIKEHQGRYILNTVFNGTGRKTIRISLKKENQEPLSIEFNVDILPKKSVLKKGG